MNGKELATLTRGTLSASQPCWMTGCQVWLHSLYPLVFGGVAGGLFSAARLPQPFLGAFVKHRSKEGQYRGMKRRDEEKGWTNSK